MLMPILLPILTAMPSQGLINNTKKAQMLVYHLLTLLLIVAV